MDTVTEKTTEKEIFISHCSKDLKFVRLIMNFFATAGFPIDIFFLLFQEMMLMKK